MRTQAIEDCRYCPNPSRVAATSGALTLHVAAFLVLMIPISVVQVPKLIQAPKNVLTARIIEQPPVPIPAVIPPLRQPQVRNPVVPVQPTPIVVDQPRPIDTHVEAPPPEIPAVDQGPELHAAPTDVAIMPRSMPKPIYPRAELVRGIEGEVVVRVRVGVDGAPVQIRLERTSGNVNLDRAALDAARKWRFFPAMQAGDAVEVETTVPVKFSILSG